MVSPKLKELLRDQIVTMADDIRKKMEYLKSGEMFSYNYYKIDIYRQKLNFKQDDALLNAFIGNTDASSTNMENSFAQAFMSTSQQVYKPQGQTPERSVIRPTEKKAEISEENLSTKDKMLRLNAKLAALRGLSMPGDYLRKN